MQHKYGIGERIMGIALFAGYALFLVYAVARIAGAPFVRAY